jgi:chromosome segregation ATPase
VVGAGDCVADGAGRGDPQLAARGQLLSGNRAGSLGWGRGREIHARRGYTRGMSSGLSMDEFQALEQKVLRAVEIVKQEREARAAAEAEAGSLREQLATRTAELQREIDDAKGRAHAAQSEKEAAEGQIGALNQERDAVRQRVERLLHQMDELL